MYSGVIEQDASPRDMGILGVWRLAELVIMLGLS